MTTNEQIQKVIADIMTAISSCSLYTGEHPAVMEFSEKTVKAIEPLYREGAFSLAIIGKGLVVNDAPLASPSLHAEGFIRKMRRKGLERIVFRRGVTGAELKRFIAELVASDRIGGSYPHISFGVVEVKLGRGSSADVSSAMTENIAKLKEIYRGLSVSRRLDLGGLEEIVESYTTLMRQEPNVLEVISPVKTYSEYTYVHNTNVSILSIFQASALGLGQEMLHDIGIAGLLHDVGKMFVPKDVLEKPGQLDAAEWEEMKKHPVYGAMYLATLPEVPRLALIAAFEHHMKFDGSGYPDTKKRDRRQHIISQIVSLSDVFDALKTERPYQKSRPVSMIVGILKDAAGKSYNARLVENFLAALKQVQAI